MLQLLGKQWHGMLLRFQLFVVAPVFHLLSGDRSLATRTTARPLHLRRDERASKPLFRACPGFFPWTPFHRSLKAKQQTFIDRNGQMASPHYLRLFSPAFHISAFYLETSSKISGLESKSFNIQIYCTVNEFRQQTICFLLSLLQLSRCFAQTLIDFKCYARFSPTPVGITIHQKCTSTHMFYIMEVWGVNSLEASWSESTIVSVQLKMHATLMMSDP